VESLTLDVYDVRISVWSE